MISEMSKEKKKWRKKQDQIQRNKYINNIINSGTSQKHKD